MPRKLRSGDLSTVEALREEHGFTAESIVRDAVDPTEVPAALHPLIPVAERWGISCDVRRGAYFDAHTDAELAAMHHEVAPHIDAIRTWLAQLREEHGGFTGWPASADTYVSLLKAYDDSHHAALPEAEKRALRERAEAQRARALRRRAHESVEADADRAFRAGEYATFVRLLGPYEDLLKPAVARKLAFARRKLLV